MVSTNASEKTEFKNTQGITKIVMKAKSIHPICPLGKAPYSNNYTVTMCPNEVIPDYCEVNAWIQKNLGGHDLIIEDCVAMLFTYLQKQCAPDYLRVDSLVVDARHPEVTVTKEQWFASSK